jgi:hypothetical protein
MDLLRAGADAHARGDGDTTRVAACGTRTTLLVRAEDLLEPLDPDTGAPTTDRSPVVPAMVGGQDVVLSREIARYLTCDCFARVILVGPHDEPLELGREYRTPPRPLRAAIVGRDRTCVFPGCDRPPRWCDAHHIQHWTRGGPTDIGNLALFCRRHHRMMHGREWSVRIDDDGLPTVSYHGIDQPRNRHSLDPPLRC